MSFADDMKVYDEDVKDVVPSDGRLSDGDYLVLIDESRVEWDEKGEGYWTWTMKFKSKVGGIRKWNNLDRDKSREIAMEDARRLGYTGYSISGLEAWLAEGTTIGKMIGIRVVTKAGDDRDFTNVYINQVFEGEHTLEDTGGRSSRNGSQGKGGGGGSREPAVAATGAIDDDIPF